MGDLAHNWQVSIAVKITAPIMWAIVFSSMFLAVLIQHSYEEELKSKLVTDKNNLAYSLSLLLKNQPALSKQELRDKALELLSNNTLSAIELFFQNETLVIGNKNNNSISAPLLLISDGFAATAQQVKIYHPPVEELVIENRDRTLLTMGGSFLIFGFFLAWIIRLIAIKPILELVDATKDISSGNLNRRLSTKREDEFGYLARFFNQMLDQLADRQSELEKTVIAAEEANKAKSAFLANMSHELRTPLNAILGYSEILLEDNEGSGNTQTITDLNNIHTAGSHLLLLIDSILDISKIEAGKMGLHIESFPVKPLIDDITSIIKPLIDKNNNKLTIEYPDKEITMISDMVKVRQILFNLLSNANKFTNSGNISIKVYLDDNDKWINFDVIDDGIGMTREQARQLFQPFTQADSSTTRKYGGTGLGLAICKHFCEMLNGDITLKSTIDMGTTFTIKLPIKYEEEN